MYQLLLYNRHGFRFYMHWTVFAAAALLFFINPWSQNGWWIAADVLVLVLSVALHESAHALMGIITGIRPKQVVILPIGGITGLQKFPDRPVKEFIISAAGPVFSLLLALITYRMLDLESFVVGFNIHPKGNNPTVILSFFYMFNFWLAVFNLIPAFPMDGGRILRSLIAMRLNYIRATAIVYQFGRVLAIGLLCLAVFLGNFIPALAGIFIIATAATEQSYGIIRSLLEGLTAGRIAVSRFYMVRADMTIKEAAELLKDNDNPYLILHREGLSAGAVKRFAILDALAAGKGDKAIFTLPQKSIGSFEASQSLTKLIEPLSQHPDEIFVVLDSNGRIKGVISFQIVMEHLLLHNTHRKNYQLIRSAVM